MTNEPLLLKVQSASTKVPTSIVILNALKRDKMLHCEWNTIVIVKINVLASALVIHCIFRIILLFYDTFVKEDIIYVPQQIHCNSLMYCFFLQQQGTYYTQPLYAAPPHVIHHTTVVQPNGMPATMYPAPIPPPRGNGVTMGMVAGTTMAMSAGVCTSNHCFFSGKLSFEPGVEHSYIMKCDATGVLDGIIQMSVQQDLCRLCSAVSSEWVQLGQGLFLFSSSLITSKDGGTTSSFQS